MKTIYLVEVYYEKSGWTFEAVTTSKKDAATRCVRWHKLTSNKTRVTKYIKERYVKKLLESQAIGIA